MKVLVADAHKDISTLLELYLNEAGHTVKIETNGEDVIKEYGTGNYDRVIMSMTLNVSEKTGEPGEALHQFKKAFPNAPTMVLTGFDKEHLEKKGWNVESRTLKYFEKPLTMSKLLEALQSVG